MFKFLKNLFKKRRVETNTFVPKRGIPVANKGVQAISNIQGVNVKQLGEGEYGICVDMNECPLSPMELIQKLIEGQVDEY